MGSFGQVGFTRVEDLMFRIYTDEEIKKISVARITNDQSINELGHLSADGVYDLRMGPMSTRERDICETCSQDGFRCQGHCGHIEIPLPIFNPVFYDVLKRLLPIICPSCFRLQVEETRALGFRYQMKLLREGYGQQALDLTDIISKKMSTIKETVEVSTGINDRDIKGTEKDFNKIHIMQSLEKTLKRYYSDLIKDGGCCNETSTSNIKAIQIQLIQKFFQSPSWKLNCIFCQKKRMKISFQNSRFMKISPEDPKTKKTGDEEKQEKDESSCVVMDDQSYITSSQAQIIMQKCWMVEKDLLKCLYPILSSSKLEYPTDMFFLKTILVIPPKYRPCGRQDGMIVEHETSVLLKNVVRLSKILLFLMSLVNGTITELPETLNYILTEVPGATPAEKVQNVWYHMQCSVNNLFDGDMNNMAKITRKGIKQIIEKKEGLVRRNLMGKRVNFSARSVAAPDPHLSVDEVGVPMDFAIRLSYPVPVTKWNVEELRQLVKNGPDVYPGALMVEDEEGRKKRLTASNEKQRNAIANKLLTPTESHVWKVNASKIVYRHLQNGDFVLMNRQPTLHRPSIQAHRARVMPKDRVLRLPYANCKAYNADFDGDELNLHFPQNEVARSEANHLVTTHNQYLTPKDGSPLAGLIQDCVVASVMLTLRGNFFSREDYYQLLYTGLSGHTERIKTLPPAIVKPKQLWSGKQIISSLIHNIIPGNKARPSFNFKTSVKPDMWQTKKPRKWKAGGPSEKKREAMTESEFVMLDGELLSGVIDKSAIGSTSYGLIHICYDLYGGKVASKLLTAINCLCVYYLKWCGHTISVKEFVSPEEVNAKRKASLNELIQRTPREVSEKLSIPEENFKDFFECSHMSSNEKDMASIDAAYTSVLGPTTSEVTGENERGLLRRSLDNHMRMMVDTGAKGSKVNMNQIASLFGSVAVDGKRMPLSIAGKFLPSFKAYDPNPCAGGYIPDRFMTGINPQAYFFLCIVGRDSLQHTAVKTAESGYVQRCLIKHLEGINVKYDMTVRNSDGLVLQFKYGEDGLDVTRVPFLRNPDTLDVLVKNYSRLLDDRSLSLASCIGDKEEVDKYAKKLRKWQRKNNRSGCARRSGFQKFCRKMAPFVESGDFNKDVGRSIAAKRLEDMWYDLTTEEKDNYSRSSQKCPDPVSSVFSGASNLGVVSEALDALIDKYYEENYSKQPEHLQKLTQEQVATTVYMKALTSIVDPGEAVGALCAQALGEPLTQMTLNTFHFAGKDELNITLGVPRMVEILRRASKDISTPIMEVPFHSHVSRAQAEALRIKLSEVSLAKVLHRVNVTSQLEDNKKGQLHRHTKIKFTFLPHAEYKHVYAVNPAQVLHFIESHFIPKILLKEIQNSLRKRNELCSSATDPVKKNRGKDVDTDNSDGLDASEETKKAKEKMNARISEDSTEDEEEEEETAQDAGVMSSLRNKKKQEQDYSEDEEADVMSDEDGENKTGMISEDEGIGEEEIGPDEDEDVEKQVYMRSTKKRKKFISPNEVEYRKECLMAEDSWIVDYDFDREKELWCEVTVLLPVSGGNYDIHSIVRQRSERELIHNISNIRRVFVVEKENTLLLRTEGVNILKIIEFEHLLDVNRLYTNNIHQVAEMYGIEAAQRSIIREIRAVQSAYDIKVDFRHLSLLADYFTCEGTYKACSRSAIASCPSPVQKMSFETFMNFLKSALLQGEVDRMASPSANIALGQPVKLGTNAVHTLPVLKFS